MRNKIITAFFLAAVALAAVASGDGDVPRLRDGSVFGNLARGEVFFPHERHYERGVDCLACHHRIKNGANVLGTEELVPGSPVVSCDSCHGSGRNLERMYHRMCIGCHEDYRKKNTRSGPVMCGRCHMKKEK